MGNENQLYSISLGVASLQGGLVGVATALSPATCRPFQVFSPSFFVGLELVVGQSSMLMQGTWRNRFPYCFHTHLTPKTRASIPSNSCIQECMMDPRADHTSMRPQVFACYHLPNISVRTFSSSGIVTEAASRSL